MRFESAEQLAISGGVSGPAQFDAAGTELETDEAVCGRIRVDAVEAGAVEAQQGIFAQERGLRAGAGLPRNALDGVNEAEGFASGFAGARVLVRPESGM